MLAKNVHMLITASKTAKPWGNERHNPQSVNLVCERVHMLLEKLVFVLHTFVLFSAQHCM